MRVNATPLRATERGAVMVITAVSMVALLAAAALAVDIGNGFQTRRRLVTTSDAAALAAAQDFVLGANGCATQAAAFVNANFPDANLLACSTAAGSSANAGAVTVSVDAEVRAWFSPVIGLGNFDADSSTTVEWGGPIAVSGLRPFGLCATGSNAFQAWLGNPTSTAVITIPYSKDDQPDACNGDANVPGNWGVIDFNGGSNPQGETNTWTQDGYDGLVNAGTLGATCDTEAFACYEGNPGSFNNPLAGPLAFLRDNQITFTLPVFDSLNELPGGNAQFHFVYFVNVQLVDFRVNGNQANRFLTLRFQPGLAQGTCCDNSGPNTGVKVIAVCAVDSTDPNNC